MSSQSDVEPAYATGVERFKQGKCPGCGKGFGQPRGLEYRRGPDDLYCHTCKLNWPMELDPEMLRARLSITNAADTRAPLVGTYDVPSVHPAQFHDSPRDVGIAAKLGQLLRRVLMR